MRSIKLLAVAVAMVAMSCAGSVAASAGQLAPFRHRHAVDRPGVRPDRPGDGARVRRGPGTVKVVQCARTPVVCNEPDSIRLITDLGTGFGDLVVRRAFTGYNADGTIYGPVDCNTAVGGCIVLAKTIPPPVKAWAPISFQ